MITPPRRRAETSRRWRKAPDAAPHLHKTVRPLLSAQAVVHAVLAPFEVFQFVNSISSNLDIHVAGVLVAPIPRFSRQVLLAVFQRAVVVLLEQRVLVLGVLKSCGDAVFKCMLVLRDLAVVLAQVARADVFGDGRPGQLAVVLFPTFPGFFPELQAQRLSTEDAVHPYQRPQ